MTAWPAALPDRQFLGLQYIPQPTTIRTEMDVGPAKVRRRATAAPIQVPVPFRYTGAQFKALIDFYAVTLLGGTQTFDWRDPANGNIVTFRFLDRPRGTLQTPGDTDDRQWAGDLLLEILP